MTRYTIESVLLGFLWTAATPTANAAYIFHTIGSPHSYVVPEQPITITDPDEFSFHLYFNQGAFSNSIELSAGGYHLTLVGPNHTFPQVGLYENATRWPFMGNGSGMDLYGHGRGHNRLIGWFNVLEADYSGFSGLNAFAVDFVIYGEEIENRMISGWFRYNSSVPVPFPIPEPHTIALLLVGLLGVFGLSRVRARWS